MIIVGLGNPGQEYEQTRHNLGFMVVDALVKKLNGRTWKKEPGVLWSKIVDSIIIKPQELMNVSGKTLQSFLLKKKLAYVPLPVSSLNVLVVHDDLDFPLGEIHEQVNRSAGGHNGVLSIIEALGTQNFSRLRIGIGNNRDVNIPAEDYVLQKFSGDEKKVIDQAIDQSVELLSKKVLA